MQRVLTGKGAKVIRSGMTLIEKNGEKREGTEAVWPVK